MGGGLMQLVAHSHIDRSQMSAEDIEREAERSLRWKAMKKEEDERKIKREAIWLAQIEQRNKREAEKKAEREAKIKEKMEKRAEFERIKLEKHQNKKLNKTIHDNCPVCMECMIDKKITWCYSCYKFFHDTCINEHHNCLSCKQSM